MIGSVAYKHSGRDGEAGRLDLVSSSSNPLEYKPYYSTQRFVAYTGWLVV